MKTSDVINLLKTKSAVAKLLGIGRSAVSQWGDFVPLDRQYELEVKTNGLLKSDYTIQKSREKNEK